MGEGPRLVIFDVDGTLVDSQAHILAAMGQAFDQQGEAMPARRDVLGVVGLSLPQAMARLAPELPDERQNALTEGYKSAYAALRAGGDERILSPLYPHVREVIKALSGRDDLLLGVATGKSRRGLDHLLETHGLTDVFFTRQVADYHPSKPHPAMIQAALSEAGVEARDTVMVGDTVFDMEMGRAAGVGTIGVSWGYHPATDLSECGADHIIDDFRALPETLKLCWSEI